MSETSTDRQSIEELLNKAFQKDELGVEVFDVDAVVPRERKIKIGGREYKMAAEVPLTLLSTMLAFEEELDKAASGRDQIETLSLLQSEFRKHLLEHNEDVPEDLGLSTQRIPIIMNYLMNGRSATEATLAAMAGGPFAQLEQALEQVRSLAIERGEIADEPEDDVVAAPLASENRSSRRSSASQSDTTGSRTGGRKRTSGRSGSTSKRRAAKR